MTEETFLRFVNLAINRLEQYKNILVKCAVDKSMLDLCDKTISCYSEIESIVSNTKQLIKINYLTQFQNDINQTLNVFLYIGNYPNLDFIKDDDKKQIEQQLSQKLESLQFNLDFFKKLGFFSKNIVAIGANGSGKTTLSKHIKQYLPTLGTVISAQKILLIPTFDAIPNIANTSIKLQESQKRDKSLKEPYSTSGMSSTISYVCNECNMLLGNLLAERNVVRNKFCDNIKNGAKYGIL
ncbi:MAG: hypothetical protein LBN19_03865 [Endomicrobium sp.]|jgi:hypothetical protein|nr:hypothetical protein [Endomicrobium sp.]